MLVAGCIMQTEVATDGYTKGEVDQKFAALEADLGFLDNAACQVGDIPVRTADEWTCQPERLCPASFAAQAEGSFTVCTRSVAGGANDVMVKVGDFWIDRYEMSQCGGDLGSAPASDTTAIACSIAGATPLTGITWFQTAQMCANAGKNICSNAQWQAAVAGTPDPGAASGASGECVTQATEARMTGLATQCRSQFGAEDMIGNLWEWVADWYQAGFPWQLGDGQNPTPRGGVTAGPWPAGYDDDQSWNNDGTSADSQWQQGLPATALRSGNYGTGASAGAFAFNLNNAPSLQNATVTGRCCIGGR